MAKLDELAKVACDTAFKEDLADHLFDWDESGEQVRDSWREVAACVEAACMGGVTGLREEFIVCYAAGYPDPHAPHPNTMENTIRFRDEHRRLPEFPAVIKRRVVSDWEEVS